MIEEAASELTALTLAEQPVPSSLEDESHSLLDKLSVAAESTLGVLRPVYFYHSCGIGAKREKTQNPRQKDSFLAGKLVLFIEVGVAVGNAHWVPEGKAYFQHLQENEHRFLELGLRRLQKLSIQVVMILAQESICLQKLEVVDREQLIRRDQGRLTLVIPAAVNQRQQAFARVLLLLLFQ